MINLDVWYFHNYSNTENELKNTYFWDLIATELHRSHIQEPHV